MNTPTRSGAPNAQARHTECSSPARELVGLLERSPRANAELLETAIASGTGPRPTAVLSQVEPSVRHSVSRLYDLVTTLRAEDDVAAGLVAEIKSLEEQPAAGPLRLHGRARSPRRQRAPHCRGLAAAAHPGRVPQAPPCRRSAPVHLPPAT